LPKDSQLSDFWKELDRSDKIVLSERKQTINPDRFAGSFNPRNSLNDLTGRQWIRLTRSWFVCDGKKSDIPKEIEEHPATFPPDVAQRFILLFTKKGGTVLDPFVGIGSTLAACKTSGRNGVGIELVEKYADYAEKRVSEPTLDTGQTQRVVRGDAFQLDTFEIPTIDLCITSPPYWNILKLSRGGVKSVHKQRMEEGLDIVYSSKPEDFGNIDSYDEYLEKIRVVFEKVHSKLRPKGFLVIVVQNVRVPKGEMIPVAWDIAKKLSDLYALKQEQIWIQSQKFLGIWGYPTEYVSNVHHHYCLIFQKRQA
jgi:DNA modification methylase